MKKILLIFMCASSASLAQQAMPDLAGTWKIVNKSSGLKHHPPPQYLLLMDDSIYVWGVDSIGNSLPGVSSGRWSINAQGELVIYYSNKLDHTRYYKPLGSKKFR